MVIRNLTPIHTGLTQAIMETSSLSLGFKYAP